MNKLGFDSVIIHAQTSVYNEKLSISMSYECINGKVGHTPELPDTAKVLTFEVDVITDTVFVIEQTIEV